MTQAETSCCVLDFGGAPLQLPPLPALRATKFSEFIPNCLNLGQTAIFTIYSTQFLCSCRVRQRQASLSSKKQNKLGNRSTSKSMKELSLVNNFRASYYHDIPLFLTKTFWQRKNVKYFFSEGIISSTRFQPFDFLSVFFSQKLLPPVYRFLKEIFIKNSKVWNTNYILLFLLINQYL